MRSLSAVPDRPPRAWLYLRQSVAREDSVSLEMQEHAGREYCERRGYTVAGVIADPGVSGLKWERRRGVQDLMSRVEAGEVDVVVVWRWSRLSRNRLHQAVALDLVERAGARVESATEPFDTTTAGGEFGRDVMLAAAHFESRQKSEQWREAHERRLRLGLPAQGGDRFGYLRDGDVYLPDPVTGLVLSSMYADYLAGAGMTVLAAKLNEAGIRTRAGGRWSRDRVTSVLDSGFAAGLIRSGRREGSVYRPGSQEPLIGQKTWERYLARRRLQAGVPGRVVEPAYPLTGLIRCGDCGAPMHPTALGRHAGYGYICSTWTQKRQCRCVTVSRSKAERAVTDWLATVASDIDARAAVMTARQAAHTTAQADARLLRRELRRVETALEKAFDGWTRELVDAQTYERVRADLLTEKEHGEKRLREVVAEAEATALPPVRVARELLARWPTLPVRTRRDMLALLLNRVVVVRGTRRGDVRVVVEPRGF